MPELIDPRLIIEWNIRRYNLLLQHERDEARKRTISELLANEKTKLTRCPVSARLVTTGRKR